MDSAPATLLPLKRQWSRSVRTLRGIGWSLPPAFGFIEYWAFPTTSSIAKLATMLRFLLLRHIVGGRATGWVGYNESIHQTAWSASARVTARSHTAPSAAASFNTRLRQRTSC